MSRMANDFTLQILRDNPIRAIRGMGGMFGIIVINTFVSRYQSAIGITYRKCSGRMHEDRADGHTFE